MLIFIGLLFYLPSSAITPLGRALEFQVPCLVPSKSELMQLSSAGVSRISQASTESTIVLCVGNTGHANRSHCISFVISVIVCTFWFSINFSDTISLGRETLTA